MTKSQNGFFRPRRVHPLDAYTIMVPAVCSLNTKQIQLPEADYASFLLLSLSVFTSTPGLIVELRVI
jgi:hypothetical protein